MKNDRTPRTLTEAFGPFATGPIHTPAAQITTKHRLMATIAVTLCAIALAAFIWN